MNAAAYVEWLGTKETKVIKKATLSNENLVSNEENIKDVKTNPTPLNETKKDNINQHCHLLPVVESVVSKKRKQVKENENNTPIKKTKVSNDDSSEILDTVKSIIAEMITHTESSVGTQQVVEEHAVVVAKTPTSSTAIPLTLSLPPPPISSIEAQALYSNLQNKFANLQ